MRNTTLRLDNLKLVALIVTIYLFHLNLALTKKLIEKVKKEWQENLKKRELELENEMAQMIL